MKIAFIDHSFHQKTRSTEFLLNILSQNGIEVDPLWDEGWNGGTPILLDDYIGSYDAFIFFQVEPKASRPLYHYGTNIIYIPMLDQFGNDQLFHYHRPSWKNFSGVKYINFSKALHSATISHGLSSKYFKYFPDPSKFSYQKYDGSRDGFFWQRFPEKINWSLVKSLTSGTDFHSFHIHNVPDPGQPKFEFDPGDINRYNLSVSEWFPSQMDLFKKMANANVYFTPRSSEGIGLSFLEAMAMGKCVVSPDYGTMNEYILHGINGLLYDLQNPIPLDFSNVDKIGRAARESAEIGYEQWLRKEPELIEYIIEPPLTSYAKTYPGGFNLDELAGIVPPQQPTNSKIKKAFLLTQKLITSKQRVTLLKNWLKKIKKKDKRAIKTRIDAPPA